MFTFSIWLWHRIILILNNEPLLFSYWLRSKYCRRRLPEGERWHWNFQTGPSSLRESRSTPKYYLCLWEGSHWAKFTRTEDVFRKFYLFLCLKFSNQAKFTQRIKIDTKILPTDWKLTFSFVTSRDCVISAKLVCSNSKLIWFLAAISQKLIVQDARQIRQGWTLKGQFLRKIWHFLSYLWR